MSKRRRKFTKKHLSIAKKALRKVNKLARRIKPEPKMHDIGVLSIVPTIAGNVAGLVNIAQGITETTRVGLSIRVFFMEFRFSVVKHATPTNVRTRIIIFRDNRQIEAVTPSVLDVIHQANPLSPYTRINPKRFTILFNKLITLRTNRIAMSKVVTRKLSFEVAWVGALGANINRNGIYLLAESDAIAGQEAIVKYTWRLRYTDV